MRRPCSCGNAVAGPYDSAQCRLCWHALNSPSYQRLWGILPGEIVTCCGRPSPPSASAIAREVVRSCEREPNRPVVTIDSGPVVWACGITTVPEREELLHRTLVSLSVGGFGRPQVFVERGLWAFGTWWHSLVELWIRNPHADRYAMFQDDLVVVKNLRGYLDRVPHPERGYWNLFTTRDNEELVKESEGRVGWVEASLAKSVGATTGQQTGRGALALVFPRAALIELLTSRHLVTRPMDRPRDSAFEGKDPADRGIDGCVVTAMNKVGYREYVHCPSLVQHVGDRSTISYEVEEQLAKVNIKRQRIAKSFPGEGFNAMSWLK